MWPPCGAWFITYVIKEPQMTEMFACTRAVGKGSRAQVEDFIPDDVPKLLFRDFFEEVMQIRDHKLWVGSWDTQAV